MNTNVLGPLRVVAGLPVHGYRLRGDGHSTVARPVRREEIYAGVPSKGNSPLARADPRSGVSLHGGPPDRQGRLLVCSTSPEAVYPGPVMEPLSAEQLTFT